MKVYVAGPMRNRPDWNFLTFDMVEAMWTQAGHRVFSPARTARALGYGPESPEADIDHLRHVMLTDIAAIYTSDALVLLEGWEGSVGATVEVALAQFLGLPLYNAMTMEKLTIPQRPWANCSIISNSGNEITQMVMGMQMTGVPNRRCPTCRGDGHHPMAPYPRTRSTRISHPCPQCEGCGVVPIEGGK